MLDVLIWIVFLAIVGGAIYYGLRVRSSSLGESSEKLKRAAERHEEQQRQIKGYGD